MIIDILNIIIDFINWIPFEKIILYGQIIGTFLSILFMVGIVVVNRKMAELRGTNAQSLIQKTKEADQFIDIPKAEETSKVWLDIAKKINSYNASDWLSAVIGADALVDDILKHIGLQGETMGERLQQLDVSKLTSLNDLWEAHKIRNRVAHSPTTLLRQDELRKAIAGYKKALRELGFLD